MEFLVILTVDQNCQQSATLRSRLVVNHCHALSGTSRPLPVGAADHIQPVHQSLPLHVWKWNTEGFC